MFIVVGYDGELTEYKENNMDVILPEKFVIYEYNKNNFEFVIGETFTITANEFINRILVNGDCINFEINYRKEFLSSQGNIRGYGKIGEDKIYTAIAINMSENNRVSSYVVCDQYGNIDTFSMKEMGDKGVYANLSKKVKKGETEYFIEYNYKEGNPYRHLPRYGNTIEIVHKVFLRACIVEEISRRYMINNQDYLLCTKFDRNLANKLFTVYSNKDFYCNLTLTNNSKKNYIRVKLYVNSELLVNELVYRESLIEDYEQYNDTGELRLSCIDLSSFYAFVESNNT